MQAKERSLWSKGSLKIKVVEGPGTKLKNFIVNKNPYPTLPCHRVECPICKKTTHTEPVDLKDNMLPCTTPSVGYQIVCLTCKQNGRESRYEGETGRTMVTRAKEHLGKLKKDDPAHPLVKHKRTDHPNDKKVTFQFNILEKFKDPLTRQAEEGLRIVKPKPGVKILNSKSEFNHPPISRVQIKKQ